MIHSTKELTPAKTDAELLADLPAPYEALLELGLTHEQILDGARRAPLIVANQAAQHPGAWFDVPRARKALRAMGAFKHTKGRWAGIPMEIGRGLATWQVVWIMAPIFGWVYLDSEVDRVVRVIRTAWIEVPRKNGKSTISSAISGVLLLADGEMGAEVYNAAGSKEQAARVFDAAKQMLRTSPHAARKIQPLTDLVRVPGTGGIMRCLSSIAETSHGLNVSGATIDEVHTLRLKRGLVEAIETGVGAREQPLIIFITTADEAEEGTVYDEKHNYTRNCAANIVQDPQFYGVIWAALRSDDPFSEATWAKANPGLGVSPTLSYMRSQAKKAASSPVSFPAFCRLSLNVRMRDQSRWLDLDKWDTLKDLNLNRAVLRGRRAWGGLDLSAVSDFTAWAVLVQSNRPGFELDLLTRFWVPEERVDALQKQLMVPLADWISKGFVTATPGDVVDYAAVKAAVVGDVKHLDMQRISYDRMFAGQLVQEIQEESKGVEIVPVAQTFVGLSPAMKETERLIGLNAMAHEGNPVMRWMVNAVEVKNDGADNLRPVKPDRKKASTRIDGVQALVTAMDGIVRVTKEESKLRRVTGRNSTR